MHKFKNAQGTLLLSSSEFAACLATNYPRTGKWDDSQCINIPGTLLNTAYGGKIEWQSMRDFEKKQRNGWEEEARIATPSCSSFKEPNVTICGFIQPKNFKQFFPLSEKLQDQGMGTRFIFGFGRKMLIGKRGHELFLRIYVVQFTKMIFNTTLTVLGVQSPAPRGFNTEQWVMQEKKLSKKFRNI